MVRWEPGGIHSKVGSNGPEGIHASVGRPGGIHASVGRPGGIHAGMGRCLPEGIHLKVEQRGFGASASHPNMEGIFPFAVIWADHCRSNAELDRFGAKGVKDRRAKNFHGPFLDQMRYLLKRLL